MHRLVASCAGTLEATVAALRALPPGVDAAEVRFDRLWPQVPSEDEAERTVDALLDATHVPLVATLRARSHGGGFGGTEAERVNLLAALARMGFEPDLESHLLEVPGLGAQVRGETAAIASHHHEGEAPCRDDGMRRLLQLQDAGAGLEKLAFASSSFADHLRALELARAHAQRGGRPCVSPMGSGGAALRALLPLAGNQATYGHALGLPPAVAGQPSVEDLLATWRHWGLDPQEADPAARWLTVLGTPVAHSLSPRMMNTALRAAGRPERFGALEVPASAGALRLTLHVADRLGLAGASITMPHKAEALRMVQADAVAKEVGAANCVTFGPLGATGTNTDAPALRELMARHAGATALVLGAGGAARAAVWALRQLGAKVHVAARQPGGLATLPWAQRHEVEAGVVVHATPLDAPLERLPAGAAVFDLAYGDAPSTLERMAKAGGHAYTGGRRLLLEQGVLAYQAWFGEAADRAAMERALA